MFHVVWRLCVVYIYIRHEIGSIRVQTRRIPDKGKELYLSAKFSSAKALIGDSLN